MNATTELAGLDDNDGDDRDYVNSLARGLRVIRAFSRERPAMTLSDVSRHTGINRAAARRFLLTLVRDQYAETDGKYFRLRPKILELGYSAVASLSFAEIVQPVMDDLAERLEEMCLAAVLDGEWVVYTARSSVERLLMVNLDIGSRLPAFVLSTGRMLLSALSEPELDRWLRDAQLIRYTDKTIASKRQLREEIRKAGRQGWAVMDEEYEVGFRSLSVPINDRSGALIAALNVCCPSARVTIDMMLKEFLPETLDAAGEITRLLPESGSRLQVDVRPPDFGAPR